MEESVCCEVLGIIPSSVAGNQDSIMCAVFRVIGCLEASSARLAIPGITCGLSYLRLFVQLGEFHPLVHCAADVSICRFEEMQW
mmetsp:Transcript_19796/g.33297  ORF Transcript_19796/g.33297 Transcript_19796/m.33297 type:complete len:84 (-) Transcript_19796:499-750(-)